MTYLSGCERLREKEKVGKKTMSQAEFTAQVGKAFDEAGIKYERDVTVTINADDPGVFKRAARALRVERGGAIVATELDVSVKAGEIRTKLGYLAKISRQVPQGAMESLQTLADAVDTAIGEVAEALEEERRAGQQTLPGVSK